jgi:acetylglutamate kinase
VVEEAISKARVLIEALPYIKQFQRAIIVIKYGGSILQDSEVRESVLTDIAFLRYAGIRPILVHGGGPHINERLEAINHPVRFHHGLRVTDDKTLEIVIDEMSILNCQLVDEINVHGSIATGFVGERCTVSAAKLEGEVDLGRVGKPTACDAGAMVEMLEEAIPVIAPMGIAEDGSYLNVNADDIAYYLASELSAEKLVFFTKELGIMGDPAEEKSLISTIRVGDAEGLIERQTITGGMVPKVRAAVAALHAGVGKVHVVDAKLPHALLLEIFTDKGIGTEIVH